MKHPFRIVLLFWALALLGIALLPRIAVDLLPNYNQPVLNVSFSLPGSTPEITEYTVTSPLENALSGLSGIKSIASVSGYQEGTVTLTFGREADLDQKHFEAATAIRQLYPQLPTDCSYPRISRIDPKDQEEKTPLLTYTIRAPFATNQIGQMVDRQLRVPLSQLEQVDEVNLTGVRGLQATISYQPDRLAAWNISPRDIQSTLSNYTQTNINGRVSNAAGQTFYLKKDRHVPDLKSLGTLKVGRDGITLDRLARIFAEEQPARSYFRINGKNTITLSVYVPPGVNKLVAGSRVKETVTRQAEKLPEGYEINLQRDDTEFIHTELQKIIHRSLLSMGILCLFILLASTQWRYLLVLITGIIVNLALTMLIINLAGLSVHLYTLAGLTISFGLIVDNAIVMLDHLHRYQNKKIFLALLSASLTTMAALGMVLFLPEQDRQNLTEFSQVIIVNLGVSLLVAILYTPAVYRMIYPKTGTGRSILFVSRRYRVRWLSRYGNILQWLAARKKGLAIVLILSFGTPVFWLPSKWEGQDWYNVTLGSDVYQEHIRPITDRALGGSLRLFVRDVYERSGYRTNEKTRLYVNAEMQHGATLSQMNEVIGYFEQFLSGFDGIEEYRTSIYSGQRARIEITFEPDYEQGFLPYRLKSQLTGLSINWGGVQWSIYGVGRGFSNRSGGQIPAFRVKMKGYNYQELERQATKLADKLLVHPRIQEVNTNERLSYSERKGKAFELRIDPERLSTYQISGMEYASALSDIANTRSTGIFARKAEKILPVVIRNADNEKIDRLQLERKSRQFQSGREARFTDLGDIQEVEILNTLHKEDRQYVRMISFDYFGSARFGSKYLDEVLTQMAQEIPVGYSAERSSWYWGKDAQKRRYGMLALLIVMIYIICAITFENLRQPFWVILTVPLSFIGIFLTFALFDFYFDQGGYAAFVLLGGLVVNAAIFIVNDWKNSTTRQPVKRVTRAVSGKFTPILLTVGSTCFGLIPFVLAGQNEVFWFALSVGVIGGLLFSLVVVFFILPVFMISRS